MVIISPTAIFLEALANRLFTITFPRTQISLATGRRLIIRLDWRNLSRRMSAIFLFLHVFFLGSVFESKILNQLRRSYIVFFIIFEILAQVFLIKEILNKRNQLLQYLNNIIVTFKFIFVTMVCLSTLIILVILLVYDLSSKVDYILEWNYFTVLLFYYLLSFLMWKKT